MAVALHYLPAQHELLQAFQLSYAELSKLFYQTAKSLAQRHVAESRVYTLDLVELLLIRTHYLYLVKTDTEELWQLTGELIITGTAMGLHRDPGQWHMSRDRTCFPLLPLQQAHPS
jgi:hypothetical protein